MTDTGIKALFARMDAMQPGTPLTGAQIVYYTEQLQHVPDDVALLAIKRIAAKEDWRPSAGRILSEVHSLVDPAQPLDEVIRECRTWIGSNYTSAPSPLSRQVISNIGGVGAIKTMSEEGFVKAIREAYPRTLNGWRMDSQVAISEGRLPVPPLRELLPTGYAAIEGKR